MAEASGFRWTTLRVATLYPLALPLVLVHAMAPEMYLYPLPFTRFPYVSVSLGLLGAGACALVLTRSLNFDWPTWQIAVACYAAGAIVASAIFGYTQLARRELKRLQR